MKKLSLVLFAIFSLTFVSVPVFADEVQDQVYTINSSTSIDLCGGSSSYTCSDYSYLILDTSIDNVSTGERKWAIQYTIRSGGSVSNVQRNVVYNFPGVFNFDITPGVEKIIAWGIGALQSGESFTLTLSNSPGGGGIIPEGSLSITSNGTYDVTNYASVDVNIDSSLPPFVDIVIDAFWKYHVAFAASIPAILAIFFVFRFIKGRIR